MVKKVVNHGTRVGPWKMVVMVWMTNVKVPYGPVPCRKVPTRDVPIGLPRLADPVKRRRCWQPRPLAIGNFRREKRMFPKRMVSQ